MILKLIFKENDLSQEEIIDIIMIAFYEVTGDRNYVKIGVLDEIHHHRDRKKKQKR